MSGLAGRTALVTGGGRGIGQAIALDLAGAGARVVIASRTQAEIDAVAAQAGPNTKAITVDVADPASVRALFAETRRAIGEIDILVNGAGIAPSAPLVKTTDEQWRQAGAIARR